MEVYEGVMLSFVEFINSISLVLGLVALAIVMYLVINNTVHFGIDYKEDKEKRKQTVVARKFSKWYREQPTRQEAVHGSLFLSVEEKDLPKNLHKWEV